MATLYSLLYTTRQHRSVSNQFEVLLARFINDSPERPEFVHRRERDGKPNAFIWGDNKSSAVPNPNWRFVLNVDGNNKERQINNSHGGGEKIQIVLVVVLQKKPVWIRFSIFDSSERSSRSANYDVQRFSSYVWIWLSIVIYLFFHSSRRHMIAQNGGGQGHGTDSNIDSLPDISTDLHMSL